MLVGPVRRPSLLDLRPDAEGARILARIGRAAFAGDDGLLAAVVRVLGEEGFRVVGAHEVMAEALGPRGLLTRAAPDAQAMADIARAIAVARALGAVDVGQGCVVQQGCVLAVEAVEGTDAMLARAGPLRRPGYGGVLVKLVKPGQDRRADLPTIGPRTIAAPPTPVCAALPSRLAEPSSPNARPASPRRTRQGFSCWAWTPTEIGPAPGRHRMSQFLHTMMRVGDLDRSVQFYTELLGMKELRRRDVPGRQIHLAFVGYGTTPGPGGNRADL